MIKPAKKYLNLSEILTSENMEFEIFNSYFRLKAHAQCLLFVLNQSFLSPADEWLFVLSRVI